MKNSLNLVPNTLMFICLFVFIGSTAHTQTHQPISLAAQKGKAMTRRASGTFEVKVNPLASDAGDGGAALGRMSLDKVFHGDIVATGKGEMLTAVTGVKGSAAYVAIERVSGTLHGRKGTFVLQHSGTMSGGAQQLSVTVVPNSGAGDLAGITGSMTIKIEGGKHYYEFEYTLADAR